MSRPPRLVALVAAAVVAMLFTSCGSGSPAPVTPPPNAAVTVDTRNVAFSPKVVTVRAGQMVAWKFDDGSIPHNVTGSDWGSPDQASGYYTHAFATPGTFPYRCTIHSNMDGQVVVTA